MAQGIGNQGGLDMDAWIWIVIAVVVIVAIVAIVAGLWAYAR
jgi:hypothetical protein